MSSPIPGCTFRKSAFGSVAVLVFGFLGLVITLSGFKYKPPLIPVTPENEHGCIEFMSIGGRRFCSTEPLYYSGLPVRVNTYDPWWYPLDDNKWEVGMLHDKDGIFMAEYYPTGEDSRHWTQRLVSMGAARRYGLTRAETYTQKVIEIMPQNLDLPKTLKPKVVQLEKVGRDVYYELWFAGGPNHPPVHGLIRGIRGKRGMFTLQYYAAQTQMDEATRTHWLALLHDAKMKFETGSP